MSQTYLAVVTNPGEPGGAAMPIVTATSPKELRKQLLEGGLKEKDFAVASSNTVYVRNERGTDIFCLPDSNRQWLLPEHEEEYGIEKLRVTMRLRVAVIMHQIWRVLFRE